MLRITQSLKHKHAAGAGLVEVLVALVVIGVGMLGIASLYVVTLQAKTTSQSRMQAVNLATDVAERIRANPATTAWAITQGTAATAPAVICIQTTAAVTAVQCTAQQMVAADLNDWTTLVTATLPGTVTRSIAVNGVNPTTYTITLGWSEPTSGNLSYTLEVQI
ncbi:MAG: type IV pilus modification protein PilV [Steroidobacteraceae bacterium]